MKEEVKTITLQCPSCGAAMKLDEEHRRAVCPYCDYEMLIEKKDFEKLEYERQMGKARAERELAEQEEKRIRRRKRKGWLIGAAVLLVIIALNALPASGPLHGMFFPTEVNPFADLQVTFSGDSGEGKIHLENRAEGELRGVEFEAAPEKGLRNGDVVVVKARSYPGYRFEPSKAEYTVEGLPEWVDETADLTEDHLAEIHTFTESLIHKEWDEIVSTGYVTDYVITPLRVYLYTADDPNQYKKNVLYDAYTVEVHKPGGDSMTVYEACYYDMLKVLDGQTLQANYGELMGFHLGYSYGLSIYSSFSGWLSSQEMEADIRSVRDGYTLQQ